MNDARSAAETVARRSYGQLLASLAYRWRDIAAAEDALAEAFAIALRRWPEDGVPSSPAGWLMTVAHRELLIAARRQRLADNPALTVLFPTESTEEAIDGQLPDHRLRLMFVCGHPAIDATIRSALILQTVLGIDAKRIASAFLVKPETMTKRLTRAKAKIKANRIRFEEPDAAEWQERLGSVHDAIFGAYTLDWHLSAPTDDLAGEALYLAELLAAMLPEEAECLGLLALLSFTEARRRARSTPEGKYVPLAMQDVRSWDQGLMAQAEQSLALAASYRLPGPYQLEAAIQAVHMQGRLQGSVPWNDIAALYARLLAESPTLGARIGHAIASANATDDPLRGLELLTDIPTDRIVDHQPWWAVYAELLARARRFDEAAHAYRRAAALALDPAVRAWLGDQRDNMALHR